MRRGDSQQTSGEAGKHQTQNSLKPFEHGHEQKPFPNFSSVILFFWPINISAASSYFSLKNQIKLHLNRLTLIRFQLILALFAAKMQQHKQIIHCNIGFK
jgi:hypothetical protein